MKTRKQAKGRRNLKVKMSIFPSMRKRYAIVPIVILRSLKERRPARVVSWPFRGSRTIEMLKEMKMIEFC